MLFRSVMACVATADTFAATGSPAVKRDQFIEQRSRDRKRSGRGRAQILRRACFQTIDQMCSKKDFEFRCASRSYGVAGVAGVVMVVSLLNLSLVRSKLMVARSAHLGEVLSQQPRRAAKGSNRIT